MSFVKSIDHRTRSVVQFDMQFFCLDFRFSIHSFPNLNATLVCLESLTAVCQQFRTDFIEWRFDISYASLFNLENEDKHLEFEFNNIKSSRTVEIQFRNSLFTLIFLAILYFKV